MGERDKLLGDLNYLKKKLQSVVSEKEKLLKTLNKHGLEVSQGGDSDRNASFLNA